MFRISAIQDKPTQKLLVEACGAEFREDFFAYAMLDNDTEELMAIAQFEISRAEGYISDLKPVPSLNDFEAMFILGRSTMNFIDLCGAHMCRASADAGDERLMRAIGFKLTDGEYFSDMTDIFDGHCDGHAKELDKIK